MVTGGMGTDKRILAVLDYSPWMNKIQSKDR